MKAPFDPSLVFRLDDKFVARAALDYWPLSALAATAGGAADAIGNDDWLPPVDAKTVEIRVYPDREVHVAPDGSATLRLRLNAFAVPEL